MKTLFFSFISAALLQSCSSADPTPSLDPNIVKVENSLSTPVAIKGEPTWSLEERMQHYDVPGVSIAVIENGKIAWARGYGLKDSISKIPVDTETLFQAGSISKPVAAYGALRLVEQHKLDLEADIQRAVNLMEIT